MKAPYSRWSSFALMPIFLRSLRMSWALSLRSVEPYVVKHKLAAKPLGYPAEASSRLASAGSYRKYFATSPIRWIGRAHSQRHAITAALNLTESLNDASLMAYRMIYRAL